MKSRDGFVMWVVVVVIAIVAGGIYVFSDRDRENVDTDSQFLSEDEGLGPPSAQEGVLPDSSDCVPSSCLASSEENPLSSSTTFVTTPDGPASWTGCLVDMTVPFPIDTFFGGSPLRSERTTIPIPDSFEDIPDSGEYDHLSFFDGGQALTLYVRDAAGRGTGINPFTGEVEENIPNSRADIRGLIESIDILSPPSGIYRLFIHGISDPNETAYINIVRAWISGKTWINDEFFAFTPIRKNNILEYEVIIDIDKNPSISVVEPVQAPLFLQALPVRIGSVRYVGLVWGTVSGTAHYNVYWQSTASPNEPGSYRTLAGSTSKTSCILPYEWDKWGLATTLPPSPDIPEFYVVTAVAGNGLESFFSNPAYADD